MHGLKILGNIARDIELDKIKNYVSEAPQRIQYAKQAFKDRGEISYINKLEEYGVEHKTIESTGFYSINGFKYGVDEYAKKTYNGRSI